MATSGYSTNSISKKLGYKEGFQALIIHEPKDYRKLLAEVTNSVHFNTKLKKDLDLIHFFTNSLKELEEQLPKLKAFLKPNGMLWVSWYKKASKKPTEITEDTVRHMALSIGLVDVKVCAIDEDWSGLKLVIPVKDR